MSRETVNRNDPLLPAHLRETYRIVSPVDTHTRAGTCAEAGCKAHVYGWSTLIDESTKLGQDQADYIRVHSEREFTEERTEAGLTDFRFAAGQKCFAEHRIDLDRPALFLRQGGDFRGNPRKEQVVHSGPDPWVDDFATRLESLNKAIESEKE